MKRLLRALSVAGVSAAIVSVSIAVLGGGPGSPQKAGDDPRKDQTYIGTQKCAACHFEQFTMWKQTKHAKGFEILPAKYKNDASCLKCHSTGFGEPTGYKDSTTTTLAGTTCEACHGPGSKHAEITKQYAKKKKLSEEEDKTARGSIYRELPSNVCITCHQDKGHKPHPKYDK
jgi:Cytochrome c554 and c-prime